MLLFTYKAEDLLPRDKIKDGKYAVTPTYLTDLMAANINSLIEEYSSDEISALIKLTNGVERTCHLNGVFGSNNVTITNRPFDVEPTLREVTDFLDFLNNDMPEVKVFGYSVGRAGSNLINDLSTLVYYPTQLDLRMAISKIFYRWRVKVIYDQTYSRQLDKNESIALMSQGAMNPDDTIYTLSASKFKKPWYVLFHTSLDLEDHDNFVIFIHPSVLSFTNVQLCKTPSVME